MYSFLSILTSHPLVLLFLFVNLAIGFWAHRKSKAGSFEDYALASRSLPTPVLVMTLLGTFMAKDDLSYIGYILKYGILYSAELFAFVFAFLLIGFLIAPCLVYFNENITFGDLMKKFYGSTAQIVGGTIGSLISLLIMTAQLRAIGSISAYLFDIDSSTAIILFGSSVVLYSMWGGVRSVSYSDIFQTIMVFIIFWILGQTILERVGSPASLYEKLSIAHPNKLLIFSHEKFFYKMKSISFWVFSGTFLFTLPIIQRMLMVRNKRQVRHMWYASSFFYSLISLMIIFIGLGTIILQDQLNIKISHQKLFLYLTKTFFKQSPIILDLIFIGIIGLLFSTIDSHLHAMGISVTQDLIVPIKQYFTKKESSSSDKSIYAKISVLLIGILSINIALIKGGKFAKDEFYEYAVLLSGLIIIPFIIGIVGIKTDKKSWLSFCLTYISAISIFKLLQWHPYDYFWLAILSATLAFFLTHLYQNSGFVTLKRSELTVSERLWIPSWEAFTRKLKSLFLAPFQLRKILSRKIVDTPTQPLSFSMVIFALYTLSSLISSNGNQLSSANFMAVLHLIGITLCSGLMLEGIWTERLKPYFPLYYFFTLTYCLPFGSTLALLQVADNPFNTALCLATILLLTFLVETNTFFLLTILGSGLALGGWKMTMGTFPPALWERSNLPFLLLLIIIFIGIFLFKRQKRSPHKKTPLLESHHQ